MKTTLFLICIIFSFSAAAQRNDDIPAKIVIGTDTLEGFLKYQGFEKIPTTINFRKSESSNWITYKPADIKSFVALGATFDSYKLKVDFSSKSTEDIRTNRGQNHVVDTAIFLKAVVKNKIASLYEFLDSDRNTHFFTRKGSNLPQELIIKCTYRENMIMSCQNLYWQTLNNQFSDCDTFNEASIKIISLGRESLRKAIVKYIECKNGVVDTSMKTEQKEKPKFSFFIAPGISSETFRITNDPHTAVDKFEGMVNAKLRGYTIQAGGALDFHSKFASRFAVRLEFGVRYFHVEGTGQSTTVVSTFVHNFSMSPTYLRVGPAISYGMSHWRLSPFIMLGGSVNYAINFDSNYSWVETYQVIAPKSGSGPALTSSEFSKPELCYFAGVGIRKSRIMSMIRVEGGTGMLADFGGSYTSKTSALLLMVGYTIGK